MEVRLRDFHISKYSVHCQSIARFWFQPMEVEDGVVVAEQLAEELPDVIIDVHPVSSFWYLLQCLKFYF